MTGTRQPIDPDRFVEVFRSAATQAGAVARHLQGKVRVERKPRGGREVGGLGDGGLEEAEAVTAVDYATQDVLLYRLHEAFGAVAMDAEEQTRTVSLFAAEEADRPLIVVDPVDGTLAWTRGSDDWAVMGALIVRGLYVASVILLPAHGVSCWATRGGGCFVRREGQAPARIRLPIAAPNELLVSPMVAPDRAARARDVGLEPVLSRCSAVDALAPVLGRARASLSEERADRRRTIGLLATLEAGGAVRFGDRAWRGEDPERLSPEQAPTVAAESELLADELLHAYGS